MNIGARITKTGLSVTLAILVANWFHMQPAVLAAVAAVLTIQPSIMKSWKYVKEVLTTNIIGAIFATMGFYLFGTQPVYIGLIVILTIAVNLQLGLNKTINLSVLTVIAILTSDLEGSTLITVANRFLMVGIGVLSSFLINIIVLPPRHDERLYESARNITNKLSVLLRIVPQKEMPIATYKEEKQSLDKLYKKTKDLFELLNEEKKRTLVRDRQFFFRKIVIYRQMIRVIHMEIDLFEKIEKHFNTMENISSKQSEEVKDTINELLQYQESIFLVYEDKIKPKTRKQIYEKRERIEDKLKCTVNDLMEHYDPANEELWWRLFPIVNALIETVKELERLEMVVGNFKSRKPSKKAKRKKLDIKETIKQIEQ